MTRTYSEAHRMPKEPRRTARRDQLDKTKLLGYWWQDGHEIKDDPKVIQERIRSMIEER